MERTTLDSKSTIFLENSPTFDDGNHSPVWKPSSFSASMSLHFPIFSLSPSVSDHSSLLQDYLLSSLSPLFFSYGSNYNQLFIFFIHSYMPVFYLYSELHSHISSCMTDTPKLPMQHNTPRTELPFLQNKFTII